MLTFSPSKPWSYTTHQSLEGLTGKDERGPSNTEPVSKAAFGNTSGRRCEASMGFAERLDTILSGTEVNWSVP